MRVHSKIFLLITILTQGFIYTYSQDSSLYQHSRLLTKFAERTLKACAELEEKLDKAADRILEKFSKEETRLIRKLEKIDSMAAAKLIQDAAMRLERLKHELAIDKIKPAYIASLDTLLTSFRFINSEEGIVASLAGSKEKFRQALDELKGLQSQFGKAEKIKIYLQERKRYLKEKFSQLGFSKHLKRINKQVHYYQAKIGEYKQLLNDKDKLSRKVMELVSRTDVFKKFMRKNSWLASLIPLPSGATGQTADPTGFAGLQTRVQLNTLLQQASGGPNATQQFQQSIQGAQASVNELRNKLEGLIGTGKGELEMPDFKPNSQRAKSFFKRLEFGSNLQSQRTNGLLPASSDLGLSAGYKLNDKSIIGIGFSYKMGWGNGGINNIRLSHEGIGLRSFVDWQLKGSFWLSGGYEQNYRSAFNSISQLRDFNEWQSSGLLGMSKVVSLKSKILKNTKLQLLWDFLSYRQRPQTAAMLFRIGYSFK